MRRAVRVLSWIPLLLSLLAPYARGQYLPPQETKNGSKVRNAFRDVVAQASRSTVRVFAGGKEAALGAIVGADGWVLTKASELKGPITCQLADERKFDARVVGVERNYDLAMLKIEAQNLPALQWYKGDDPAVGGWLATPGLEAAPVAVGVMSVKRRRIPPQPGILGISLTEAKPGPRITQVLPNSSADKAGLRVGDIIISAAGSAIEDSPTLTGLIRKYRPGDFLNLRVMRGEEQVDLEARLEHPVSDLFGRGGLQNAMGGKLSTRRADFPAVLQHDTVLRSEDCGGPVVDLQGRAIGLNIARAGRTETYTLPAGEILPLLEDLQSGKLAPPTPSGPAASPPLVQTSTE